MPIPTPLQARPRGITPLPVEMPRAPQGPSRAPDGPVRRLGPPYMVKEYEYCSPHDGNGIVYSLGLDKAGGAWNNPVVCCTQSNSGGGYVTAECQVKRYFQRTHPLSGNFCKPSSSSNVCTLHTERRSERVKIAPHSTCSESHMSPKSHKKGQVLMSHIPLAWAPCVHRCKGKCRVLVVCGGTQRIE